MHTFAQSDTNKPAISVYRLRIHVAGNLIKDADKLKGSHHIILNRHPHYKLIHSHCQNSSKTHKMERGTHEKTKRPTSAGRIVESW